MIRVTNEQAIFFWKLKNESKKRRTFQNTR